MKKLKILMTCIVIGFGIMTFVTATREEKVEDKHTDILYIDDSGTDSVRSIDIIRPTERSAEPLPTETYTEETRQINEVTHEEVRSVDNYIPDNSDASGSRSDSTADTSGSDDNEVPAELDLWDAGLEWYGISYEDTTRTLKLITYEGYGDSMLSYYVACCCWSRATEGYWGYGNLYRAFGEMDTRYDTWMDSLDIADYAYTYLWMCYENPTYCRYCNGMATPANYLYAETRGSITFYAWN